MGRSRLKKPKRPLVGLDQPVIPVAPPVHDVDDLGLGVAEDEEVVADELELDARWVAHEPVELAELLLGVRADLLADLEVAALDLETHLAETLSHNTCECDHLDAAGSAFA